MYKRKATVLAAVCLGVVVLIVGVAGALALADPAIDWWVFGGGGGSSSAGAVTLNATLGQPVVGPAAGGDVALQSGFWVGGAGPSQVTHALSAGWTLLAPNLATTPATLAEAALDEIEVQGGSASEVYRWLSLTDAWDGHVHGLPFNNFPLELGQGYFFKSLGPGNWQRSGYPPPGPVAVALNPVWTLIGVPVVPGAMTAEDLLVEATAQGGDCTEIYRWDAALGSWEGHVRGLPFGNFAITNYDGYFLKCALAATYTPGGSP